MSVTRLTVLVITCPTCGKGGRAPEFITRGWDGKTYGFACGHEHHLDEEHGGAATQLWSEASREFSA